MTSFSTKVGHGCCAFFLGLGAVACGEGLEVNFISGSGNRLSLETSSDTNDLFLISESANGATIDDQINLRYSADFEISNLSAPVGWAFQNISVNSTEKKATYFYVGTNPDSNDEFYNFSTAADFRFQVKNLTGNSLTTIPIKLEADLTVFRDLEQQRVTTFIQRDLIGKVASSLLIDFRETNGLAADGSQDLEDFSENGIPNLFYYAFGLGSVASSGVDRSRLARTTEFENSAKFSYIRHRDQANDDLQYVVQASDDLITWVSVSNLPLAERPIVEELEIIDSTYEMVALTFAVLERERFYRLALIRE